MQVSIVMPTYNCGKFITETIDSVLQQTYKNWELIIIDDCSTDNTEEVVNKYISDRRIKYVCLDVNSGAAMARNKGIEMASGKYIAFLDSDDLWTENKLDIQIEFMEKNKVNITNTTYEQIDENGKAMNKIIRALKRVDYNRVLLDCPIGNSTVIYNAENLGKIEIPNIRKRNDDALWLKMLKKEKYIYGIDEILMSYRIRENSISKNKLDLIKYHWYLYREIEHISIPKSIFHIGYWCIIKVFKIK